MNNMLLKKILDKLSLQDLFNEVKTDDKLMFKLGSRIMLAKRHIFCAIVKSYVENAIASGDKEIQDFLKNEIINLDGDEDVSINGTLKRKLLEKKEEPVYNPCSSGRTFTSNPRC